MALFSQFKEGPKDPNGPSKGLIRRYNKHVAPVAPVVTPTTNINPNAVPAFNQVAPNVKGVSSNVGDHTGFVNTKKGATVFQANPWKGDAMGEDKTHMKRTIQEDRKQGWNNFKNKLGFRGGEITSFKKGGILSGVRKISPEMKELITPYLTKNSEWTGNMVTNLNLPISAPGTSSGANKDGFFVYTHRARSKAHQDPKNITQKERDFVKSTG